MTITGIFTIRNGIKTGYPFVEAILSLLPITDEFLISDGGSTDGTFQTFLELKKMFPNKIKLSQIQDKTSKRWECIDVHINYLISKSRGNWIYEVQGDELFHENDIFYLKETIEKSKDCYKAILQPRWDLGWESEKAYTPYNTIRCIKNIEGMTSLQGGDYFCINNYFGKLDPVFFLNVPFYHFTSIFPKNFYAKAKRHSKFLATVDGPRHNVTKNTKDVYNDMPDKDKSINLKMSDDLPSLIKGMRSYNKYFVRPDLFNKKWLTETTGLNYFFD